MHYLYKKAYCEKPAETNHFLSQCQLRWFQPRLLRLFAPEEKAEIKSALSRAYFWLITGGKFRIAQLLHDRSIVHTAFVVPRCSKFSFLKKGDYEIGPCVTAEAYRRQGAYRFVLEAITGSEKLAGSEFYMIVRDSNMASIKGIENAGFVRCGSVTRTKWLRNYKKEKDDHG